MSKIPRILILLGLTGLFATSQVQQLGPSKPAMVLGNPGSATGSLDELKPYTAGGHILGFRKREMFIASGDHALKVEFVGAGPISPGEEAKSGDPESSRPTAQPLGKVSYPNLWDGVTLAYENHRTGVVKSTYRIEPVGKRVSSPLSRIRLRYNVPVNVDGSGSLVFSFPTGEMRESRPVAWQEIEGNRVPVEVTYRLRGDQEVGFEAKSYDPRFPLVIDPVLSWNAFLGSSIDTDHGYGIAVDTSGNVYVTGYSWVTWGSPVRLHSGSAEAFVAKLDGSGALQWNTFLGGSGVDRGYAVAVDGSGNIYVAGESHAAWGSGAPLYVGGADAFAAKLNNSGVLQWNAFLGSSADDFGYGITVDGSGNIYVAGESHAAWGSGAPLYVGGSDAFAAKLNNSGVLQWNTFLGSSADDRAQAIATYGSASIYVTGYSKATWGGSPRRSFTGGQNAFIAKLDGLGALQWNTFLGGGWDFGYGIAVDNNGIIYVGGMSGATWGAPVRSFAGSPNIFVAKVDANGILLWNSFLGGPGGDYGPLGIALDTSGNVYATGTSAASWGSPIRPYVGGWDAFAVKLDGSGVLQWNAFLGGGNDDYGYGIAVDLRENVLVVGSSYATWGSPVRPFAGGIDAFAAKISPVLSRIVDFNGDGMEDILWRHYASGDNAVWLMGMSGGSMIAADRSDFGLVDREYGFERSSGVPIMMENGNPFELNRGNRTSHLERVEEFTSGKRDQGIAAIEFGSAERRYVAMEPWRGVSVQSSIGRIGYAYLNSIPDLSWKIVGTGDFNGDGKVDILWHNDATSDNAVWFMNGVAFQGYTYLQSCPDRDWKIVGTGDFNGDGKIDILWRQDVSGYNAVWFMNGVTFLGYRYLNTILDPNWKIVGTGDFNGDGKIDILWHHDVTNDNAVWFMDGVNCLGYFYLNSVPDLNWKIVGTGDFNADGKVDILWRHNTSGADAVWYMNGTTFLGYEYLMGVGDLNWKIVNR